MDSDEEMNETMNISDFGMGTYLKDHFFVKRIEYEELFEGIGDVFISSAFLHVSSPIKVLNYIRIIENETK